MMTRSPYTYSRRPSSRKKRANWKIWAPIVGVVVTATASIIVALLNNWLPFDGRGLSPTPALGVTPLPPKLRS
jgi:hypothetical protein